jgi:hypothetical protein
MVSMMSASPIDAIATNGISPFGNESANTITSSLGGSGHISAPRPYMFFCWYNGDNGSEVCDVNVSASTRSLVNININVKTMLVIRSWARPAAVSVDIVPDLIIEKLLFY